MKTEKVKLSQVNNNAENPRTITQQKFEKLVNSILVLPKMLELRPIVVTDTMEALGGNMRNNALKQIATMTQNDIASRLQGISSYKEKTQGEREALISWWKEWLKSPFAYIIKASDLTKEEQRQFIIKDNVSFGSWDYDMLSNKWEDVKLAEWGMDIWVAPSSFQGYEQPSAENMEAIESDDTNVGGDNLPEELRGVELTPQVLPKIQGKDEVALERIIIVYAKEQTNELERLLGIAGIKKVVYRLEEILSNKEE